jgi:hypothetical protein
MTGPSIGWRYGILFGLLVAASVAASLAFACAMPFAALAAVAALHLDRRRSLAVIAAAWVANQLVGYLLLDYPRGWDSFAWGGALLAAAAAAVLAAEASVRRLGGGGIRAGAAALLGGFAAYELALALAATVLPGSWAAFAPAVLARILIVNAAVFVALLGLHRLGGMAGLVAPARRATPLPA